MRNQYTKHITIYNCIQTYIINHKIDKTLLTYTCNINTKKINITNSYTSSNQNT